MWAPDPTWEIQTAKAPFCITEQDIQREDISFLSSHNTLWGLNLSTIFLNVLKDLAHSQYLHCSSFDLHSLLMGIWYARAIFYLTVHSRVSEIKLYLLYVKRASQYIFFRYSDEDDTTSDFAAAVKSPG